MFIHNYQRISCGFLCGKFDLHNSIFHNYKIRHFPPFYQHFRKFPFKVLHRLIHIIHTIHIPFCGLLHPFLVENFLFSFLRNCAILGKATGKHSTGEIHEKYSVKKAGLSRRYHFK